MRKLQGLAVGFVGLVERNVLLIGLVILLLILAVRNYGLVERNVLLIHELQAVRAQADAEVLQVRQEKRDLLADLALLIQKHGEK